MGKHSRRPKSSRAESPPHHAPQTIVGLRIIGGQFRGRRLHYTGDTRTRPMKDRLREAVFNLIGPSIRGKHAIDLFAGTGALALESLSRGADRATLIEQHRPTANIIRQNAATLGVEAQTEIVVGNVFIWFQREFANPGPGSARMRPETPPTTAPVARANQPWAVFCSPPYDFYVERGGEMMELIAGLVRASPAESVFIVEADARLDFQTLPDPTAWDVRRYPPAVVGIYRKE